MELTQESVQILFSKFTHNQQYKSFKVLQSGHINTTVLIETQSEKKFVLQRLNSFVFTNPQAVIHNKIKVSNHLHNKFSNLPIGQREQQILSFVNAVNNQPFFVDAEGNYLYQFGKQGSGQGEFWMPSGIFIDHNDHIYVADSYNKRIQVFELLFTK